MIVLVALGKARRGGKGPGLSYCVVKTQSSRGCLLGREKWCSSKLCLVDEAAMWAINVRIPSTGLVSYGQLTIV